MDGPPDLNGVAAALLRDMAAAQAPGPRRFGYKRAAAAVRDLDEPLEALLEPDGTLRKIKHVGPASARILLEVLRTGTSAVVEDAVRASPSREAVQQSRALRANFLSRAQVAGVLRRPQPGTLDPGAYRGDLQMHSTWSDGADPLDAIAAGCEARGYAYCAVTDHAYGLRIARGVSIADFRRQHAEIDALNARRGGRFRMLKGVEANILAGGEIDLSPGERGAFEIVVASPHSVLRSPADQTARMVAAVSAPGVHILGHPRGRMYGSRPGITADWDRVFAAAAAHQVAIEIDGDPARQDADFALAALAVRHGCLIAVDSDAHGVAQLAYAEIGVAHARLAGVPRDRIVNAWEVERLLAWASVATGRCR